MSWKCASCGWVNPAHSRKRSRQKCGDCRTPADAPARNVSWVSEKTQGTPSHGVRQKEQARVQTWPNGTSWA